MQGPYNRQQSSCMCSNCMRKKLLAAGKPRVRCSMYVICHPTGLQGLRLLLCVTRPSTSPACHNWHV